MTAKMASKPKTEAIKCISVQQPHSDDIFFGGKWCENRGWSTDYRGELWIASSSKVDEVTIQDALDDEQYDYRKNSPTGLATSVILGRVNLVECVPSDLLFSTATEAACKVLGRKPNDRPHVPDGIQGERAEFLIELLRKVNPVTWRHFFHSKFAWIIVEAEMLENPIPIKGQLRIWSTEIETARLELASPRKRKWKIEQTTLTKSD